MKEHQVDFKVLKAKVGIDDIAYSLGYQIDRKAGLGRYIELVLPDGAGGRRDTIIVSHIHDKAQQTFFRRNGQRGDVISFIQENANSFGISGRNNWDIISKVMAKFADQPIDEKAYRTYAEISGNNKPSTLSCTTPNLSCKTSTQLNTSSVSAASSEKPYRPLPPGFRG